MSRTKSFRQLRDESIWVGAESAVLWVTILAPPVYVYVAGTYWALAIGFAAIYVGSALAKLIHRHLQDLERRGWD
jgi:hypothetical protein